LWPEETIKASEEAAKSLWNREGSVQWLRLSFKKSALPRYFFFIPFDAEQGEWYKNEGNDFCISLDPCEEDDIDLGHEALDQLANVIIESEVHKGSWTLMHRFNLCHDLLSQSEMSQGLLAMMFVWLRYSELRQLDWQRRYNTKPRELAHAQNRLTLFLSGAYAEKMPRRRQLLKMILSTLGRGGEGGAGQAIRDDILNIMHRHHIKENSGHFMEEWHQKLHNNTTPDDVVICQAYLKFLYSEGDLGQFYGHLDNSGISRERLRSFERPILSDPDYLPHIKDGLIWDFENYLKTLQRVHDSLDLCSAIEQNAVPLPQRAYDLLDFVRSRAHHGSHIALDMGEKIGELRGILEEQIDSAAGPNEVRDLIYLDLSLSEMLRRFVEGFVGESTPYEQLTRLLEILVRNVLFTYKDKELAMALQHWQSLSNESGLKRIEALRVKSVSDRISRVLMDMIDETQELMGDKASLMGKAFDAEEWVINGFIDAVVRGSEMFALSLVQRQLDEKLRQWAEFGDWQVISPGDVKGEVLVVESLAMVQDQVFDQPTVLVVDQVGGEEEPPRGVVGILTPCAVDVLSHLSVRTRTYGVLFATCYHPETMVELRALATQIIRAKSTASGDLLAEPLDEMVSAEKNKGAPVEVTVRCVRKRFEDWVIPSSKFCLDRVGGKSLNLIALKDLLPDHVALPSSVAIPYGVYEHVLVCRENNDVCRDILRLGAQLPEQCSEAALLELRKAILQLKAPDGFRDDLARVIAAEGMGKIEDWDKCWSGIVGVWASKWNWRAHLSRRSCRMEHNDIFLAVLVQQVVPAEYAYVIHTVNPFTGNKDEVYAELVLGLGETLVSGEPGRALSFTYSRSSGRCHILSFPSKGKGIFGSGLIFRSDSNGEDLENYAGAGLYDSFLQEGNRFEKVLDYRKERLFTDLSFCYELMEGIGRLGVDIESACDGVPQDIEGVWSNGLFTIVQTRAQMGL
jgi:alpha-glucan,water dikinase